MRLAHFMVTAAAGLLIVTPGLAQPADLPPPDDGSNSLTIGLGVAAAPSYEGSDDYVAVPAGLIRGRVSGFIFFSRATALYFDVAREPVGEATDFLIGPMANLRLDRSSRIRDARVEALGDLDAAIELGGFVGIGRSGLLNPYDYAQARLDVLHDVTGTHDGLIVTPTFEYGTPLSRSVYVGLGVSADYVSNNFADTYYSVSTAGAARSGLSPYSADSGFKNARFTLLANYALSGDLRHGASLFGIASYSRLFGKFADSPLVSQAGDADQLFIGAGLAYSF